MFDYITQPNFTGRTYNEYAATLFFDGAELNADHLSMAVFLNNEELVNFILCAGVDPNELDSDGETALFKSYRIADGEEVRELLLAAGAKTDIRNSLGKKAADYEVISTFISCLQVKNYRKCEEILKDGFSPDIMLNTGRSILSEACYNSDAEIVQLLLKYKADPNFHEPNRSTALYYAVNAINRKPSLKNDYETYFEMLKLLLDAGASMSGMRSYSETNSIARGFVQIINMTNSDEAVELYSQLIKNSKNMDTTNWYLVIQSIPNCKNIHHKNQLLKVIRETIPESLACSQQFIHYAVMIGYPLDVDKIRSMNKMTFRTSYNSPYDNGTYPLLYIAVRANQSPEVIEFMLKNGADANWRDRQGRRAVDVARSSKVRDILKKYTK